MLERIKSLADRAIDAYARAVALSTAPEQQEARAKILAQLTVLYKNFHSNSDTELNELIASFCQSHCRNTCYPNCLLK